MKNSINWLRAASLAAGLCLGAQLYAQTPFGQLPANCGEYSTAGWSTYNGTNFSFNYPPDWSITQDTPAQVMLGKDDMVFAVIYTTDFGTNVSNALSSEVASLQKTAVSGGYMVSIDPPIPDDNGTVATYLHLTGPKAVDIWIEAQPAPGAVFLTYLRGTPNEVFCNEVAVGWPVSRSVHSLAGFSVVGNWTASVPSIRSLGGILLPLAEQYTVSLTFTSDKTYTYNVDQVAPPAWQLRANGLYTTAPAPQNDDNYPETLQLQPQSVSSTGISNMSQEMFLLGESGLPTDVGGSFLVNVDKDGSLDLLKAGIPPIRFTKANVPPPSPLFLKNVTLSSVAPPASGCAVPPASTSFTISDGPVYLYFEATVTASDNLSASWLAPDGSTQHVSNWTATVGSLCFKTQLNIAGDQGHLGTWRVNISDNGSQAASISFTLSQSESARPVITNLSQTTVSAGSDAFSLTVTGAQFASGAIVSANQTALPTTFMSTSQLTATVGANFLAVPGTLLITVSSGGQVSLPASITVAPRVSSNLPRIGVLAQVAAGGGWDTEIYLTNSTSGTLSTALSFYADSGTALTLPLTAVQQGRTQNVTTSTLTASIPPNTTLAIDTGTVSGNSVQGWVDVHSDGPLTGFAVFRLAPQGLNSGPGITTPWEGTVPLQTSLTASTVIVPFDNTNGFATGLALGNASASNADFVATFFDDTGNPLGSAQTITLNGNGHTAFLLNSMFDFTANIKGLMKVTGSGVTALGLRASPYGTLTSVPVPLQ